MPSTVPGIECTLIHSTELTEHTDVPSTGMQGESENTVLTLVALRF